MAKPSLAVGGDLRDRHRLEGINECGDSEDRLSRLDGDGEVGVTDVVAATATTWMRSGPVTSAPRSRRC